MNTCAQRTPSRPLPPKPMHTTKHNTCCTATQARTATLPLQYAHTARNKTTHTHTMQRDTRSHNKPANELQQDNNTYNDSRQARKPHLTGQMQKQNTRSCRFNSPPTPVSHQDRGAPEILREARTNRTALERPEKTHSNATLTYRCGQKRHTTTVK